MNWEMGLVPPPPPLQDPLVREMHKALVSMLVKTDEDPFKIIESDVEEPTTKARSLGTTV